MFWINGQSASHISLADRSFQYGDGCFTTVLTKSGKVQEWVLHKERMQSCLAVLGIHVLHWDQIKQWVDNAASPALIAGVKLHVSRGAGGRGYAINGANDPVVTISQFSYPTHYPIWQELGVKLGICQGKLGQSSLLGGHKHNNRLEQVLLKAEAEQNGHQDALVMDIQNHIIETTMANLFWLKGDTLYTPDLSLSGVAGICRKKVLIEARNAGLTVQIEHFVMQDICSADEVFMTNALVGVAPVVQIGEFVYPIGTKTRYFQGILN